MKDISPMNLTIEQAEEILARQEQLPAEELDIDLIKAASERILAENHDIPGEAQIQASKEAVWKNILSEIQAEARPRGLYRYTRRLAVIAASVFVVLIATGICSAMGLLPWKLSVSWDRERFGVMFITRDFSTGSSPSLQRSGLSDELDALLEKHLFHIALPSWMPEGYEVVSAEEDVMEGAATTITAIFMNGEKNIMMEITRYEFVDETVVDISVEKSDTDVEIIEINEIEVRLYDNLERAGAMWYVQPYFVTITGDIPHDDISRMIRSIKNE